MACLPAGVKPLRLGHNPATWMLEVTAPEAAETDWPEHYRASALAARNQARADELVEQGAREHAPLQLASEFAQPFGVQVGPAAWGGLCTAFVTGWSRRGVQAAQAPRASVGRPRQPAPTIPSHLSALLLQVRVQLAKYCRVYWRDTTYNLTRLLLSIVFGLVFGVIYYGGLAAALHSWFADALQALPGACRNPGLNAGSGQGEPSPQ
jgi:hypothetical protein